VCAGGGNVSAEAGEPLSNVVRLDGGQRPLAELGQDVEVELAAVEDAGARLEVSLAEPLIAVVRQGDAGCPLSLDPPMGWEDARVVT